ncbi:MAG: DUF1549 domain-containing protein, partial [Verrucomicrobia bacterium]|nr:DUF1549 domain-containing protein [Verrucomicrobiota bacterium]
MNAACTKWMVLVAIIGVFLPLRSMAQAGPALRSGKFSVSEEDRRYWAFQPVVAPAKVELERTSHRRTHPIDALVRSRLVEKRLAMNPQASPRELVRRAYFDLLGLPPTPADVAAFQKDPSDKAWAELI